MCITREVMEAQSGALQREEYLRELIDYGWTNSRIDSTQADDQHKIQDKSVEPFSSPILKSK